MKQEYIRNTTIFQPHFLAACLLLAYSTGSAGGDFDVVIQVDRTLDMIEGPFVDCGISTANCTLRAAIRYANNQVDAGKSVRIEVPAGQYPLQLPGAGEDAAATGDLDVLRDLTITGAGMSSTVLDGNEIDRVIHVHDDAGLVLENLAVTGGQTTDFGFIGSGGGIRHADDGSLHIHRVAVIGNDSAGDGGGIYFSSKAGGLYVEESTIADNIAGDAGGGIHAFSGRQTEPLAIRRSTISGNETGFAGGGLYLTSGGVAVEASTISGNLANGRGGGLHFSDPNRGLVIRMSTIVDNNADTTSSEPEGGGIFSTNHADPVVLQGTIIAGNHRSGVPDNCATTGSPDFQFESQGYNLSDDDSCNLTAANDLPETDPLLDGLGSFGGPTQTHPPLAGSPAIDAGPESCAPAVDQRGASRPVGERCDIGAVEFGGSGEVFADRFEQ